MELYGKNRMIYLTVIFIAYLINRWVKQPRIPEHMLGQQAHYIPEFLDAKTAKDLLELVKKMETFPSNNNDLQFYNRTYEHVGEAEQIRSDGNCESPFLAPNANRQLCILPGRIDIVRHYMKYGGVEGLKESYEMALSRLQTFGRYMFDLTEYPLVEKLFNSARFIKESKTVCPKNKQILDPFQFNFIIQVPGQTVPLHIDAVYFWRATRFQYPQWLLTVMEFSGLYREEFIDQVVAYLHEWNTTHRGGQFAYWNENMARGHLEPPEPRAGSIIDGSKMIHAATLYHAKRHPPYLPKDADNKLVYKGDDNWELMSDEHTLRKYKTADLRISIVYRARCFESEEKRTEFNDWHRTSENVRPVEEILEELKEDMVVSRGYDRSKLDSLSRLKLAFALLDEYIAYPLPANALIPFNYCVLDTVLPWLKPLLQRIC